MKSLEQLAAGLEGATLVGSHQLECPCPKCGGKATIRDFGARRSFRCEQCGTLEEADFKPPRVREPEKSKPPPKDKPKTQPRAESAPRYNNAADDILRLKPPQNIEVEQSVLGAILIDNEQLNVATKTLRVEHFYREAHRTIFASMLSLHADNVAIDALTLCQDLRGRGLLEAVGDSAYIADIVTFVPPHLNVGEWAGIVRDMAVKRDIASKATQLATLAYNGVSADALVGEAERLLRVPDEIDQLPELIKPKVELMTIGGFIQAQNAKRRSWVIDGFLAKQEISLWSGKVEHGKSTLMRTMVMCVARGIPFLERNCMMGRVLYLMLDADGAGVTHEEFERLGANENDSIYLIVDPVLALRKDSFNQVYGHIRTVKPDLVLVDPIGRLAKYDDFNDYGMTYAMGMLSELARVTDCHISMLHHIPRGRSEDADVATAAFGSIAVAGGVNSRFVCRMKPGRIYTVETSQGKGAGFRPLDGEQTLQRDPETGWVSLVGAFTWKDQARAVEDKVLECIEQSAEEEIGVAGIAAEVGCKRSIAGAAAKSLYKRGLVSMRVLGTNHKHMFSKIGRQGDLGGTQA